LHKTKEFPNNSDVASVEATEAAASVVFHSYCIATENYTRKLHKWWA